MENDPLARYLEAHSSPEPDHLSRIDRLSHLRLTNGRMCSGHVQGRLLKMLTAMVRPRRALEIGTFSGYSALCIAEGLPDGAILDTIEANDELEDFIRENVAASPYADRIRLHIGPAEALLPLGDHKYDLVFIDANKRHYRRYFDLVFPLVNPGGYIIADNTLWDGHVVDPSRHDPQTDGIALFNDAIAADHRLECVMLPLRDGLTLIRKLTE